MFSTSMLTKEEGRGEERERGGGATSHKSTFTVLGNECEIDRGFLLSEVPLAAKLNELQEIQECNAILGAAALSALFDTLQ